MTVTKEAGYGHEITEVSGLARDSECASVNGGARALERPTEDGLGDAAAPRGALDAVSRESQVPAHELESWKRVFLETGARGLKSRMEPEERELKLARAKIGELMMRLELAENLIEKS
jgi:hypothetical protein